MTGQRVSPADILPFPAGHLLLVALVIGATMCDAAWAPGVMWLAWWLGTSIDITGPEGS